MNGIFLDAIQTSNVRVLIPSLDASCFLVSSSQETSVSTNIDSFPISKLFRIWWLLPFSETNGGRPGAMKLTPNFAAVFSGAGQRSSYLRYNADLDKSLMHPYA